MGILDLLAGAREQALGGAVFNVGSGTRRSILEILEDIASALGRPAQPRHEPPRDGEVRDSEASIERSRAELGFEPTRRFAEAVSEMVLDTA